MPVSNSSTRERPRSLARYIAASASRNSSSGLSCVLSRSTTPTDADARWTSSPSSEGAFAPVKGEGLWKDAREPPRDPQRHRLVRAVPAEHHYLVAAEAPDGV